MVMTYELWIKDTASFGRPRSKELKAVDNALNAYKKAELESTGSILNEKKALQQAMATWKIAQQTKGQDWKKSIRNKNRAVEKLDGELGHVMVGAGGLNHRGESMIDARELLALKIVSEAIKQNTRLMFSGQTLSVRNSKGLADLNGVRTALDTFKVAAKDIKNAATGMGVASPNLNLELQKLLASLFGEASANEARAALGPVFSEFLTSVTPFVGALSSGAKAISNWGRAAKTLYDKSGMKDAAGSFAPGDPAAAFDAVLQIMTREMNMYATTASVHTVGATAKAAFTVVDFGTLSTTLIGAAESLALVVQKIYLFARDWNEMKAVNTLLTASAIDLTLFKTCPLLGCYLIANSDTSAVINMAVADYGKTNWQLDVETMVKKAKPVFEKARSVIQASRYEIVGMRGMKGSAINRTAKTLGLPTGKLSGFVADIAKKVDAIAR